MYVILAYDVNVDRVAQVLKVARQYLTWVQNSLLEGELTQAQFEQLTTEILDCIDESEDSVLFFRFRTSQWLEREAYGQEKGDPEWIV